MQRKCLVCSTKFSLLSGPKERLYCSAECSQKARWVRESSSIRGTLLKILKNAKYRAEYKNVPFDIDLNYLLDLWSKQSGKCSLTGFSFELGPSPKKGYAKRNAVSLDRLQPELGYIKGNVRFITYQANCAKGSFSDEDLVSMCSAIANKGAA